MIIILFLNIAFLRLIKVLHINVMYNILILVKVLQNTDSHAPNCEKIQVLINFLRLFTESDECNLFVSGLIRRTRNDISVTQHCLSLCLSRDCLSLIVMVTCIEMKGRLKSQTPHSDTGHVDKLMVSYGPLCVMSQIGHFTGKAIGQVYVR